MRILKYFVIACVMRPLLAFAGAQDATQPPGQQHAILSAEGRGVQIYVCQSATNSWQWVFQSPEAKLFDSAGKEIGTHGGGPMWKGADGSVVTGKLVAKADAPASSDIPWLLLKSEKHEGKGVFSAVEYIRRSETHGGVAPAGGCDREHAGAFARIAYTATYTFYISGP